LLPSTNQQTTRQIMAMAWVSCDKVGTFFVENRLAVDMRR